MLQRTHKSILNWAIFVGTSNNATKAVFECKFRVNSGEKKCLNLLLFIVNCDALTKRVKIKPFRNGINKLKYLQINLLFIHSGRFIMGQNLGVLWSTAALADDDGDFPQRIRNWFNEVQKYAWGAKWSVKTGHYSQVSTKLIIS